VDVTHYVLRLLSWMGIVWDLQNPPAEVLSQAYQPSVSIPKIKAT